MAVQQHRRAQLRPRGEIYEALRAVESCPDAYVFLPEWRGISQALAWVAEQVAEPPYGGRPTVPTVLAVQAQLDAASEATQLAAYTDEYPDVRAFRFGVEASLRWAINRTDTPPTIGPGRRHRPPEEILRASTAVMVYRHEARDRASAWACCSGSIAALGWVLALLWPANSRSDDTTARFEVADFAPVTNQAVAATPDQIRVQLDAIREEVDSQFAAYPQSERSRRIDWTNGVWEALHWVLEEGDTPCGLLPDFAAAVAKLNR